MPWTEVKDDCLPVQFHDICFGGAPVTGHQEPALLDAVFPSFELRFADVRPRDSPSCIVMAADCNIDTASDLPAGDPTWMMCSCDRLYKPEKPPYPAGCEAQNRAIELSVHAHRGVWGILLGRL